MQKKTRKFEQRQIFANNYVYMASDRLYNLLNADRNVTGSFTKSLIRVRQSFGTLPKWVKLKLEPKINQNKRTTLTHKPEQKNRVLKSFLGA